MRHGAVRQGGLDLRAALGRPVQQWGGAPFTIGVGEDGHHRLTVACTLALQHQGLLIGVQPHEGAGRAQPLGVDQGP